MAMALRAADGAGARPVLRIPFAGSRLLAAPPSILATAAAEPYPVAEHSLDAEILGYAFGGASARLAALSFCLDSHIQPTRAGLVGMTEVVDDAL